MLVTSKDEANESIAVLSVPRVDTYLPTYLPPDEMSTPAAESTDLVLLDFAMEKQSSVFAEDNEMLEGGTIVDTIVKQVNALLWVSNMYGDLVREIRHISGAITVMINEKQGPREMAPDLVRAYEIALSSQHALFSLETEAPQRACREDYLRVEAASIQFSSEVKMSMEYTQLTAEQRTQDMGSRLLQTLNDHAHWNAAQMGRIDNWAEEKNRTITALDKQAQETKDSLDAATRDMEEVGRS